MHIDSMLHAVDKQALVDNTHDQCPRLVFVHAACIMHTCLLSQAHIEEPGSLAVHHTYKAPGQN